MESFTGTIHDWAFGVIHSLQVAGFSKPKRQIVLAPPGHLVIIECRPFMRRFFQSLLILMGCVHLCGGGLGFLQVMAWTGMAISYSAESGVSEGLRRTFDGEHPCPLCHAIASVENPDESSGSPISTLPVSIERLAREILWLTENSAAPACMATHPPKAGFTEPIVLSSCAAPTPPVPPPRTEA
jgi:hypothetical protein